MFNRSKESNSVTPVEEMEGTRRATGVSSTGALANAAASSDPEVLERPQRRRFTAKYKLQVLQQADACTAQGEIGALLRREGYFFIAQTKAPTLRKGLKDYPLIG